MCGCERCVSAKLDLRSRSKPSESEIFSLRIYEGGFREIQFAREALHPLIRNWAIENSNSCRVSGERLGCECVHRINRYGHWSRNWDLVNDFHNNHLNNKDGCALLKSSYKP